MDERPPKAPLPGAPVSRKSPSTSFLPWAAPAVERAAGQLEPVPVSAYFQSESRSSGAPIALKLRFHIHMPYFSEPASINGSPQTSVLKISGFQSNPSEELCAASDGCGARRDPRGSPFVAVPSRPGAALCRGRSRRPRRGGSRPPPSGPGLCPAGPALWRWGAGGSPSPLPPGPGRQKLSETIVFLVSGSPCRAL